MGRKKVIKSAMAMHLIEKGLSIEEFAKKSKLNPTTLRLVLNGHYKPSKDLLQKIYDAFKGKFSTEQIMGPWKRSLKPRNVIKAKVDDEVYSYLEEQAEKNATSISGLIIDSLKQTYLRDFHRNEPIKFTPFKKFKRT